MTTTSDLIRFALDLEAVEKRARAPGKRAIQSQIEDAYHWSQGSVTILSIEPFEGKHPYFSGKAYVVKFHGKSKQPREIHVNDSGKEYYDVDEGEGYTWA